MFLTVAGAEGLLGAEGCVEVVAGLGDDGFPKLMLGRGGTTPFPDVTVAGGLLGAAETECAEALTGLGDDALGDGGLPNVIEGRGGTMPSPDDVFVLVVVPGDFPTLLNVFAGFFAVVEAALLFCPWLPKVVEGRGGAAPPEKALVALLDNLGLGDRFDVGDLAPLFVAVFGVYDVLGKGGTEDDE